MMVILVSHSFSKTDLNFGANVLAMVRFGHGVYQTVTAVIYVKHS